MKYYIVKPETTLSKNEQDYRIIKVNPVDEANFLEDYEHQVVVQGDSMMEAFTNFEKWKSKG